MLSATALNEMVVSLALPTVTFEGNSKLAIGMVGRQGKRGKATTMADLFLGVPASSRKTASQSEWRVVPDSAVGLELGSQEG